MRPASAPAVQRVAGGGLLVGAALGLAGTIVGSPTRQATLWAIRSEAPGGEPRAGGPV